MKFTPTILSFSIFVALSNDIWAHEAEPQQLETIQLHATTQNTAGAVLTLGENQLKQSATTIGEVLANQPGIQSSGFGAGASRPVVRGQDAVRAKVLSNAGDSMDVSSLSPDHVITVDPQLAEKIELIRGPASLLYSGGSTGGVMNVIDQRIPTKMPERGYDAKLGFRYNTGNDERLTHAGVTVGLGDHVALKVEGVSREANNYIAPNYVVIDDHGDHVHQNKKRRVTDSFSESDNYNIGLSWIGDRGFAGVSYAKRKDQYGLPGHSHEYESCHTHGLKLYCKPHDGHGDGHGHNDAHGDDHGHHHHDHDHDHGGPWIDMVSERYDFRSELNDPFIGFKKLKFQAGYTDYYHNELEGDELSTRFESKAYDGRLELQHHALAGWEGSLGTQYSQQKLDLSGMEAIMAPTKTQKYSLFALEQKQIDQVQLELSGRFDHQKIDIDSPQKNYDGNAYSFAAATHWEFIPNYNLSLTASHQQRLPLAQELYSDGKHFATNTYEKGTENLTKEKSNQVELGFNYDNDRLHYDLNIYHQWFDDYIYAKTLDRYKDFRLIKYTQDNAKFYGLEGQVNYQVTPMYNIGLFGDYVRGKIDSENAPRVPAGRLGTKLKANFDEHWSGSAEYYHVFKQDKISAHEHETSGYNMLNLGVAYTGQYKALEQYRIFFNANNLLDSDVYQHASFLSQIPQMGRNFMMGVDFKF